MKIFNLLSVGSLVSGASFYRVYMDEFVAAYS